MSAGRLHDDTTIDMILAIFLTKPNIIRLNALNSLTNPDFYNSDSLPIS